MADADSVYELSSDQEADPDAIDGDIENDDTADDSITSAIRKKSRRKKLRRPRGIEKSSGDSDSQNLSEDQDGATDVHHHHCHHHDGGGHVKKEETNHMSGSDAEADTEGMAEASQDLKTKPIVKPDFKRHDEEQTSNQEVDEKESQKQIVEKSDVVAQNAGVSCFSRSDLIKAVRGLEMISTASSGPPKSMDEAAKKRYQFWETQPVPKLSDKMEGNEEIEPDKTAEDEIRQKLYPLPQGFTWGTLDINPYISRSYLIKPERGLEMLSTASSGPPKSMDEAAKKRYQFWETQPVPKLSDKMEGNEEIEPDKTADEIRQEPYSLPQGFTWDTLDINNPLILNELYTLLNENYVEDDDNMFRFDYSTEFLQWALQPPGWLKEWHCGVRVIKSGKLVGFISAIPAYVKIYEKKRHMVEINFLCVHKKLRSKRVAPVLIREITRRVHVRGIFQAVYTAGVVLPKPVACCRYWHRSLNPKKLIEVKFSHLSRNMTMQRTLKLYKLPDNPKTPGFRPFTPADTIDSFNLMTMYLGELDLAPIFSIEEFKHWFVPRKGIIDSYVVEHNGTITDFVSFYTLPSTVMHHPIHKSLKAAYSFYNVSRVTPWVDLIQDALIVARNMGFDVFNALDLMQNKSFLNKLKFGIGDGYLQYYLYNWCCSPMEPHQVGLVLQ